MFESRHSSRTKCWSCRLIPGRRQRCDYHTLDHPSCIIVIMWHISIFFIINDHSPFLCTVHLNQESHFTAQLGLELSQWECDPRIMRRREKYRIVWITITHYDTQYETQWKVILNDINDSTSLVLPTLILWSLLSILWEMEIAFINQRHYSHFTV